MERLRKSFRRAKNKNNNKKETVDDEEESNVAESPSVENEEFGDVNRETFDKAENLTRMQRLRNSMRIGKKRDKNKTNNKNINTEKEESPELAEDQKSEDDPFQKNSKFRNTFRLGKSKKKDTLKEEKSKKKKSSKSKWETDEDQVRNNKCEFKVSYLGSVEVMESRGMEVCESAIKNLKQRALKSKSVKTQATLQVSGDGLRVVEKDTGGMLVDQVIEKVSFCAPDRNYSRGFAYISRDGASRRWVCHGFMAKRDTGERLSHAVGVAFAVCLERKQARECEGVTGSYDSDCGTFTRFGSFKQGTITERLMDPQEFKEAVPKPPLPGAETKERDKEDNPFAIERPKAGDAGMRSSMRGGIPGEIKGLSPFKRGNSSYSSLRVNELPSNLARREKSRVSLILEETFENEETKNEINSLISKMNEQSLLNTSAPVNLSPSPGILPPLIPTFVASEPKQSRNVSETQSMSYSVGGGSVGGGESICSFPPVTPSPPHISSIPILASTLPSNNNESNFKVPESETPPSPVNPWDLVPDQGKLKLSHSRHSTSANPPHSMSNGFDGNSNCNSSSNINENPADLWLASLTDNCAPGSRGDDLNGNNYETLAGAQGDPLDTEWLALAKRNTVNGNQNPFKAYV